MNRVFPPLKSDHPLVTDQWSNFCPLCKKNFFAGQRVMLIAARMPKEGWEVAPASVAHATCCLEGMKTKQGIISRIKDGDGSPFPVIMENGKQFKLEEIGLV